MFLRNRILWAALISCFAAAMLPAQTPATPPAQVTAAPAPAVRVQTRLVVLDVLVTDSHGNPVKSLTLNDFQLREDGAVRALKTAEEHGDGAPDVKLVSGGLPVGTGFLSNKPPSGEVWNVLLLDLLNPVGELQASSQQQLEKFVRELPPEQPVALVIMGSPSMLAVPFNSGAAGVLKFLAERKASVSSMLLADNTMTLPLVSSPVQGQPNAPVKGFSHPELEMGDFDAMKGAKHRQRLRDVLSTFAGLATWLGRYPGRKNVYWLSEGFPRLEEDSIGPGMPQPGRHAGLFGEEQQRMDKLLQNARIAVSPIDITGVHVERPGLPEWERIGTLQDFAEQTGGVLRRNNNDIGMLLREEFNRSRDFYTLTYTPSSKNWNGQLRKISLSVKPHGYQLAYRQGYYAVDANFKPPTMDDFNRALKHGVEQVNDVVFSAHLNKDANRIVLDYFIDPHSLQFATVADGRHNADLDCEVAEYDASGNLLGTARTHSLARVPQKQWPHVNQTGLPGHVVIPAEPKLAFVKLGIRDSATGRFGTLEVAPVPAASSR
jgi:VWFA-related protein